ncbi:hypothetical protein Q604_UNBc4C00137G0001, partial [human gut metagenome]
IKVRPFAITVNAKISSKDSSRGIW